MDSFKQLSDKGLIQLRILDHVGCEKFAEYVFDYINSKIFTETEGRVRVLKVESFEGGTNNSAIYEPVKINSAINQRKIKKNLSTKTLL